MAYGASVMLSITTIFYDLNACLEHNFDFVGDWKTKIKLVICRNAENVDANSVSRQCTTHTHPHSQFLSSQRKRCCVRYLSDINRFLNPHLTFRVVQGLKSSFKHENTEHTFTHRTHFIGYRTVLWHLSIYCGMTRVHSTMLCSGSHVAANNSYVILRLWPLWS